MKFVQAINALTNQVWGLLTLTIGCIMLVATKKWGIDTTIAGGIVGAGVNMLTAGVRSELKSRSTDGQIQTTTAVATNP